MHFLLCPLVKCTDHGTGVRAFLGGGGICLYSEMFLGHLSHSGNLLPLVVHCPITIRLWYSGDLHGLWDSCYR